LPGSAFVFARLSVPSQLCTGIIVPCRIALPSQATDYDKDAPKNETGYRRWKNEDPQFRVAHGASKIELVSVHTDDVGRAAQRRKRVPRLFQMVRTERESGEPPWVRSALKMGVLSKAQARQIARYSLREERHADDAGPRLARLGELTHHEQSAEDMEGFRQMFEG